MRIVQIPIVAHLDSYFESLAKLPQEIDQVRIGVVEQRSPRPKAQGHSQSAAERLDKPLVTVAIP
jgi:hypothetical protein